MGRPMTEYERGDKYQDLAAELGARIQAALLLLEDIGCEYEEQVRAIRRVLVGNGR